jgi:glycosyltransferase involved in cell wall biosynthesis
LKIAFVSGLSDKKLSQKLGPLQALDEVDAILLFRRRPYYGKKVQWIRIHRLAQKIAILGDLFRFFMLLVKGKYCDVLIGCNQTFHGLMAYLCGRIWKKPVIQIVISEIDRVCESSLLKHVLLSASACAVRGPISYKKLRDMGYKRNISILPNPYSIPARTANVEVHKRYYDFVAVGDFAKAKAYPWMMHVLGRVKERWPDLKVGIAGGGQYQKKLASLLSSNDLNSHIDFLGWKGEKELEDIYINSKALLLSSKTEGLPMVVVEAMSYRLPVFATDVGDLSWIVRDGKDGRILTYGDTQGMAEAMLDALNNQKSFEKMGKSAYARIVSISNQFDINKIAQTWSELLNFVLKKGRR